MRDFQKKLNSGEYIHDYMGYYPSDLGIFYDNENKLGGEEPFLYLCDFFSGVWDVEWWDNTLLQKLSEEKKNKLLAILKRNVFFKDYVNNYRRRNFDYSKIEFLRLTNMEKIIFVYLNQKINNSQDLFNKMYENHIQCIKEMNVPDFFKEEYSKFVHNKQIKEYQESADKIMRIKNELSDKDFIDDVIKTISE